jgi:2-methylcitrate dehydratase PrpD
MSSPHSHAVARAGTVSGTPADTPLTLALARRVLEFPRGSLDASLAAAARTAVIDTVAVTLLGASTEAVARLRATLGARLDGPAQVFGRPERASVLDAALINGVASHALDYDDFTQDFGGHPSVPVVPGLLALAEARGVGGAEFLAAYVAGVEAETRIAHAVHFHHYEKGWHPTSTLGVFGAAAAAAHLLRLDEIRTATALAIAASLASGLKANFGTMTKPLHVGHCARSGVHAALLAEQGFDANLDVMEHPQGFLEVYNGAGHYRAEAMLVPWYAPPLVLSPGISLKEFPCCGSTHPAIYMAISLRDQHAPRAQDIERIRVLTHPRRLPHTDNPDPVSALEAKFSMQYCVARALLDGAPRLAHFEDDACLAPEVRALTARVEVAADDEMARRDERAFGAHVFVHLRDGRVLDARVEHMPGRGPEHPMSEGELRGKFMDCAVRALPAPRAQMLFDRLTGLESLPDLSSLTPLAAPR